ncbi:isochorismate synthase [Actinokineospora auranticolor]|uniref:isochorismate synthase n=1 Tax=Actinokineospora auranticolor TaxID=155976 RepID=A0A2S6GZ64_9PSEU|nr:isochorismate synthase [Actinokineospora auranticolor]PPK70456.1 isochorismate synthase [Actinokineospora auranticolor]
MDSEGGATRLFDGSFLLAGPETTVVADGVRAVVAETDPDELATRVTKDLVDSGVPVAVGALPFDGDAAPHVLVPQSVRCTGTVHPYRSPVEPWRPSPPTVTEVPTGDGYRRAVAAAVSAMRADEGLRKVVLARTLELTYAERIRLDALLPGLVETNPSGYTFATPLPGGATLFGASPELLLSRRGSRVESNPLAGSRPRGADDAADRAAGAELLASAKDLAEHRVVVAAVVEGLRPFCRSLTVPSGPSLVGTPTMWHLSTKVTGELVDLDVSALRLAAALHPTPAVCGTPRPLARTVIGELEPFSRGFYGGAVGWCSASGDGEWVVGIRCGEVLGSRMRLYSGAGIMPESDPTAELDETSAKFATLLRVLGL